jgi:hypothetical protein
MHARIASVVVFALSVASAQHAHAETATETCIDATVEGQKLQRDGKLMGARERFLVCSSSTCPADVVSRCERWARGVTELVPSIVTVARDDAGHDLPDVRVTIDDRPPQAPSARAIELDPGEHRVRFERRGARTIEQRVVLHDAEKNRLVVGEFPSPKPLGPSTDKSTTRPVPATVWVLGGIGIVGLASFGVFAAKGANDRTTHHCDTGCPTAQKNDVDAELRAADISLGVAVVTLGVATWFYLTRPTVAATKAAVDERWFWPPRPFSAHR